MVSLFALILASSINISNYISKSYLSFSIIKRDLTMDMSDHFLIWFRTLTFGSLAIFGS